MSDREKNSVLFVAPSAYLLSGLATWLDYIVPGLNAAGWIANVGLVSGPHHHQVDRYLSQHPAANVKIAHCSTGTPEGRFRVLRQLFNSVKPDLAISVNIPDVLSTINRLRSRSESASHAVMAIHGIEAYLFNDARSYQGMLDGVICVNKLACKLSKTLGGMEAERCFYAPCGTNTSIRSQEPSNASKLNIVYVGRIDSDQKRSLDLIPIVRELKKRNIPFKLEIVGRGPETAELQEQLSMESAKGDVVFHGYVPRARLIEYVYPQADVLLITSSWETGPLVAWEAMAQGLAVVSSRYIGSGLERALIDGETAMLYDVGDGIGAVSALQELWADREKRSFISAKGQQLVRKRYSYESSTQAWDSALKGILAMPQKRYVTESKRVSSGKLDRFFGSIKAETIRSMFYVRQSRSPDAGGEWPHTHSKTSSDHAFWSLAGDSDGYP